MNRDDNTAGESVYKKVKIEEKEEESGSPIYITLNGFETTISEEAQNDNKINRIEDIFEYFKDNFTCNTSTESQSLQKFLEPESVFKNRVQTPDTALSTLITTKSERLHIRHRFMRYSNAKEDSPYFYFQERDSKFGSDAFINSKLDPHLLKGMDDSFELSNEEYKQLCSKYKSRKRVNLATKGFLIGEILTSATEGFKNVKIIEKYEISVPNLVKGCKYHMVCPDHIIVYEQNDEIQYAIIVTEDKHSNIADHDLLQNYDQIHSCWLHWDLKEPFIFGILTDLTQWRFTCFVAPESKDFTISQKNFLNSSHIGLYDNLETGLPTQADMNRIIKYIRGLILGTVSDCIKNQNSD